MKNITTITYKKGVIPLCTSCKIQYFICFTPNGGDYITCPLCNGIEYKYKIYPHENYDDGDDDDMHYENYCDNCGILYINGCLHLEEGCTDSTYNAHFISKWMYIPTGEIFNGMPYFENSDDWKKEIMNIKILQSMCPNNNNKHCSSNTIYSKINCPQYYNNNCTLSQTINN